MSLSGLRPPLRLLLGGDVMLGRLVAGVLTSEGPEYPFAALSALIGSAGLFIAPASTIWTCAMAMRVAGWSSACEPKRRGSTT